MSFLPPLEMRPSSIAPNPVESREAPPNSTVTLTSPLPRKKTKNKNHQPVNRTSPERQIPSCNCSTLLSTVSLLELARFLKYRCINVLSEPEEMQHSLWYFLSRLVGITRAINMNSGKLWEMVRDREAWCAVLHGVAELNVTGRLNNI